MPHAIIRGANGRRHEVDFGDAPVRVEIYASEETVEIFIEADFDTLPEEAVAFTQPSRSEARTKRSGIVASRSPLAVRPGEGRLTEPTAAARLSRQQRRPMPLCGHS